MPEKPIEHAEMLTDAPKNWGRWGAEDEIGCLNFLTDQEVLRGIQAVKQGKTFMRHARACNSFSACNTIGRAQQNAV